jgi:kinesin family protein 11
MQDSFEDDRAKILMILCASPDVKDLHKTICTLEYGAKAKCIVRLPNSPSKEQMSSNRAEQVQMLEARLTKKDAYIEKLHKENEAKHRQNEERERELERKDRELAELREKERRRIPEEEPKKRKGLHDGDDEDFNLSPLRRRKLEELTALVASQQREIDLIRIRAEKAEAELLHLQRSYNLNSNARVGLVSRSESSDAEGGSGVESPMEKRTASSFGQS